MKDLFGDESFRPTVPARARRSDPDTSHGAAEQVDVSMLERVVMADLRAQGSNGSTTSHIADRLGMADGSITPRMVPLEEKGFVRRNGKRRGIRGKKQIIWIAIR